MTRDDWRTVGILLGLEARRHLNRLRGLGQGQQVDGRRTATAGKRRSTWWIALIGVFACLQILFLGIGSAAQGRMLALDRPLLEARTWHSLHRERIDADAARTLLAKDPAIAGLDEPARSARLDDWIRRWQQRGPQAFAYGAPPFLVMTAPAANPDEHAATARMSSLLLLIAVAALVCHGLGFGNRDLARSDDPRRLLAQQPVSDRAAVAGRVLAATLTEPIGWLVLPLFTGVLAYHAGWTGWSCCASLALVPGLALAAAGLRTVIEELLRHRLGLTARRWAQGILTTASLVLLMALVAPAVWRPIGEVLMWLTQHLPLGALPTTWMFAQPTIANLVQTATVVLALGLACALAAIAVAAPIAQPPVTGSGTRLQSRPQRGALGGFARDLLLLRRDPLVLVQTLIVPAVLVLLQVVFNRHAATAALGDPRHIAAVAIFVGCYPLSMVTLRAFSAEVRHLWIPWMTPASPTRMLAGKALVGAGLATAYAVATLVAMQALGNGPAPTWQPFAAVAACLVLAAIAVPLGALGTRLERGEPVQQLRASAGWTLFLAQGVIIAALYVSPWQVVACLVILAAFAASLWQRLDHDLPWILDPTDHPPARLDAARACGAILAYLLVQTVAILIAQLSGLSAGTATVVGAASAATLAIAWTLATLGRSGVPAVRRACAVAPNDGQRITAARVARDGLLGIATGLSGAAVALAWSWWVINHNLMPEDGGLGELPTWALATLAVGIAPLVEEFLFRGLLFHAVRAWLGVPTALVAATLLFTVIHPVWGWPAVATMGFLCAVLVNRTGWLLAPVVAHATYNLVVTLASG